MSDEEIENLALKAGMIDRLDKPTRHDLLPSLRKFVSLLQSAERKHYAGELKRLQEHNAALVVSLDEFFYRVRAVVQFDDAEWVCDIGAEILKQLKEGPK